MVLNSGVLLDNRAKNKRFYFQDVFTFQFKQNIISVYIPDSDVNRGGFKNVRAAQGDSVVDWLEIDLGRLSGVERVTLINEIMDMLTAQELGAVRESADKKRSGKLKDARECVYQ